MTGKNTKTCSVDVLAMNQASTYWEHCEDFCTISISDLYSVFLTAEKRADIACKFLQNPFSRMELCQDLPQGTSYYMNVLYNMPHHQHFQRTLHLCIPQRAGLCVTGTAAGLMRPAGNPRAEPLLALRLWNLPPVRYPKISNTDKMPSALVQLSQFPSEAGAEQPLELLFSPHFYN